MKKQVIALAISLTIALGALAGYVLWYRVIAAESGRVTLLDRELVAHSADASRTDALKATLSEIENDEALVQGYFVSEANVAAFVDDLEARGRALGAVVNTTSVANADTPEHSAIAVALIITGPFDAVLRTIGSIEYAPYDLMVSSLVFTRDVPKPGWRADLKLVVGSAPTKP